MSITSRANRVDFALGFAPQTAKGAAASVASARFMQAMDIKPKNERMTIHPQGSTGSLYHKDTFRNVASKTLISAKILGAREFLGPILESMAFGAPTVSNGNLTEANDTGNNLSAYTITGLRPGFNAEYTAAGVCKLYLKLLTNVLYVYSDAARTQLVAQGNAANGAMTCVAMNNSGLSIALTGNSATPVDNATITLTINTITVAFATNPTVYWTLFVQDTNGLRVFADCVAKSIKFSCEHAGPLMLDCEWWGMPLEVFTAQAATSYHPNAVNVYAHNSDLVVRSALKSSPITQDPVSFDFTFDRDLNAIFGTSAVPQAIYSRLIKADVNLKFEPSSEADALVTTVGAWDSLDAKFTNGGKLFSITFDKMTLENPNRSAFGNDDVEQIDLHWLVVEETASSPAAAIAMSYQP